MGVATPGIVVAGLSHGRGESEETQCWIPTVFYPCDEYGLETAGEFEAKHGEVYRKDSFRTLETIRALRTL